MNRFTSGPMFFTYHSNTAGSAGLEHQLLKSKGIGESGRHVSAPLHDRLCNPFGFKDDRVGPGVQRVPGPGDGRTDRCGPRLRKLLGRGGASGTKLDPDLRLDVQPRPFGALHKPVVITVRHSQHPCGHLDNVIPELCDRVEIKLHRVTSARQCPLDGASGACLDPVSVDHVQVTAHRCVVEQAVRQARAV